jgi:chromosome partitioning protein
LQLQHYSTNHSIMKIAVTNLKGGVGKTTISQNIAVCFAQMGFKTCIVDTDTNQNSLAWLGARDESLPHITVVGCTDAKALSKTVESMNRDYEVVVVDGTPSLSEMTTRIILSCDILIIPILPSAHDFRAMQGFFERYEQAKEFKPDIPAYFLINQYSSSVNVYKGMRDAIQGFGVEILNATVNKRAAYVETALEGKGVYESSDTKAKQEIIKLTLEILDKAKIHGFIKSAE